MDIKDESGPCSRVVNTVRYHIPMGKHAQSHERDEISKCKVFVYKVSGYLSKVYEVPQKTNAEINLK